MLLCYLYSGARRAEFFQLRWQDVDFINGRIRLHWKKNRLGTLNAAWIAMTDEAMEALRDQHRATGSCKWVFVEPGTALPYQVPHAMDAAFMQAGRSGKIWFSWNTPFVRVDLGE